MFTIALTSVLLLIAALALQRWSRARSPQQQNVDLDAQLDALIADFDRAEKSMARESRQYRRANRHLAKASTRVPSNPSDPSNPNPKRKRGIPRNTPPSRTTIRAVSPLPLAATITPPTPIALPTILPAALNHAINQTRRYIMFVARPFVAIPTFAVRLIRRFFAFGRKTPSSPSA